MIKVNLHQRKAAVGVTAGSATGGTAGLGGMIERLKGGGDWIYPPWASKRLGSFSPLCTPLSSLRDGGFWTIKN